MLVALWLNRSNELCPPGGTLNDFFDKFTLDFSPFFSAYVMPLLNPTNPLFWGSFSSFGLTFFLGRVPLRFKKVCFFGPLPSPLGANSSIWMRWCNGWFLLSKRSICTRDGDVQLFFFFHHNQTSLLVLPWYSGCFLGVFSSCPLGIDRYFSKPPHNFTFWTFR